MDSKKQKKKVCDVCKGSGGYRYTTYSFGQPDGDEWYDCKRCNGTGEINRIEKINTKQKSLVKNKN